MPATTTSIVNAATAEWARWGRSTWNTLTGAKHIGHTDDEDPFAQIVRDTYCALLIPDPASRPSLDDISDDRYYWSAVAISHMIRQAGFTRAEFPISQSHSRYLRWAVANKKNNVTTAAYWGYRVDDPLALPDVGDIVGYARGKNMTNALALNFFDKTSSYESHSDIVVAKRATEIDVIGGNVRDSVTRKTLKLDAAGKLANDDGVHHWFVVLKKRF